MREYPQEVWVCLHEREREGERGKNYKGRIVRSAAPAQSAQHVTDNEEDPVSRLTVKGHFSAISFDVFLRKQRTPLCSDTFFSLSSQPCLWGQLVKKATFLVKMRLVGTHLVCASENCQFYC